MAEVGKRIKEKRKELRLTQVEVAKRAGISQSSLSDIEKVTKNPSVITIELIASALSCSIADLLGDSETSVAPTPDENELLDLYRLLNCNGKQLVIKMLKIFSETSIMQTSHQSTATSVHHHADKMEKLKDTTKVRA